MLSSVDAVAGIEDSLRLKDFEGELRQQQGLWNNLQQARRKARTNAAHAALYKRLLEQGIARVKQTRDDPFATAEEQESAAKEFLEWLHVERQRLDIASIERSRICSVEPWCERWLPRMFEQYRKAFSNMCDAPSRSGLASLKRATTALLEGFVSPTQLG